MFLTMIDELNLEFNLSLLKKQLQAIFKHARNQVVILAHDNSRLDCMHNS